MSNIGNYWKAVVGFVAPGAVVIGSAVMDGSDGLAGLPGFTPRPPDVGVEGSHTSELVLVAKTYTV